jgi:hypothetical protein
MNEKKAHIIFTEGGCETGCEFSENSAEWCSLLKDHIPIKENLSLEWARSDCPFWKHDEIIFVKNGAWTAGGIERLKENQND